MTSHSLQATAMDAPDAIAAPDTFAIRVVNTLDAAEAMWRAFEVDAVASPYQRFDWAEPYARAMLHADEALRIVTLHDSAGRLVMLLPLVTGRQHGLRIATPLGGKHANFNVPLMRAGFSLTEDAARAVLKRIGRELHVDLIVCRNAPQAWHGVPNPMAAGGRPSPSNAYKLELTGDAEATLIRVASGAARKKLRNKERALAKNGAVAVIEAKTETEVDRLLDALLAHKKRRFHDLGITDPYAGEAPQRFVRDACLSGLAEGRPGLVLYALTLDNQIIATLGGAADGQQFSGMFISFDTESETAKFTPGEILVADIIRRHCAEGRGVFDLGVGEARYKRTFCNEVEPLFDSVVGVTAVGRLYGLVLAAGVDAKRRFKASPRAMRLLALARRARSTGASD